MENKFGCRNCKSKDIALSDEIKDIRTNWTLGDAIRDSGLETPDTIRRFDNISYGPFGEWNLCDVYVKKDVTAIQPTIVNVHGGGWVYGTKETYQYYCMSLAERGFTVVNMNYRLAPEYHFPSPIEDINEILTFIEKNGKDYFIDKDNLILIGDSAGAQLVSHYCTIFTNEEFASKFDLILPDVKIKAVALNCGVYDGRDLILEGIESVFFEYIDHVGKEPSEEILDKLDTLKYLNDKFPPAYVMSCVHDFLLKNAEPMYNFLVEKGVEAKIKIYGTKEREEVLHVFHVNMRLPEATECNDDECDFFRKYVS